MFTLPISFGWMAHQKIQEKNISVQDKAKGFVVIFFSTKWKGFHLFKSLHIEMEAKTK